MGISSNCKGEIAEAFWLEILKFRHFEFLPGNACFYVEGCAQIVLH